MRASALVALCLACGCAAFAPPPNRAGLSSAGQSLRQIPVPAALTAAPLQRRRFGSSSATSSRAKRSASSRLHAFDLSTVQLAAEGVSAWSVTSVTADLAAQLFQASLLPYLAFLYFLSRPETGTPKGGTFGFQFLLVFVAATIPAGIIAKVQYNEILANIDYLHGIAESFLTITNLLIVKAFRDAVIGSASTSGEGEPPAAAEATAGKESSKEGGVRLRSAAGATVIAALAAAPMLVAMHPEPANALSWPTWMVHVSSIIEWLVAMAYIWRYAALSGLQQWKGLTWGMVPLHTSGLCACTYHILYNSPDIVGLVPLQAGLTCFGNATMALATYRIWQAGKQADPDRPPGRVNVEPSELDEGSFYAQLAAITIIGAALVKWGELLVDFPFSPSYSAAAALIFAPTTFNIYKWYERSQKPDDAVTGLF